MRWQEFIVCMPEFLIKSRCVLLRVFATSRGVAWWQQGVQLAPLSTETPRGTTSCRRRLAQQMESAAKGDIKRNNCLLYTSCASLFVQHARNLASRQTLLCGDWNNESADTPGGNYVTSFRRSRNRIRKLRLTC